MAMEIDAQHRSPVRERPFETFIGFLCIVSGVPMAAVGLAPNSATRLMPEILIRGWGVVLAMGGILVLAGILLRYNKEHWVMGLVIERSGYWPLISGTLVFSIAILVAVGVKGLFPAMTDMAFALCCAARHWELSKLLKRMSKLVGEDG